MARPLRIEFAAALHHVTSRGNERKPICRDDHDRARFLERLAAVADGKPQQQIVHLRVDEFLRRWTEHVPVEDFHMIRTWGVYAATQREALAHCRRQLLVPPVPLPEHERSGGAEFESLCPVCAQPLVLSAIIPRAGAPPRQLPADHGDYRHAA